MKIGIIGYGRFGAFWADLISPFAKVVIYDKNGKKAGKERKISFKSLREVVDSDMLYLLVPISEMENCCKEIAPFLKPHTTVIDACSVKVRPVKTMLKYLPKGQPLIATHPLFGPESAARQGVPGLKFVICPLRKYQKPLKDLKSILKKLQLKIIMSTPEDHDRQMASSQALVHFIGRGLTALDLKPQEISTPDYETLLRMNYLVQNNTWQLFMDMMNYNPYAAGLRRKFVSEIKKVQEKIKRKK